MSKFRKTITIMIIIILCLLLLVFGGCTKTNKPQDNQQVPPQKEIEVVKPNPAANNGKDKIEVIESEQIKPQDKQVPPKKEIEDEKPNPTVIKEKDKIGVIESDQIPGWKKLEARVSLNELTEYGSNPTGDNKMVEFSIHFPGNWTLESTVFCDSNNKKVAEITPTVLLNAGQESIFLDYQLNKDFGEELVSKEQVQIDSYKGLRVITKMPTESGSWYPHIYHLTDQSHGFRIFFYSEVINKEDQELFDSIVKTFKFE